MIPSDSFESIDLNYVSFTPQQTPQLQQPNQQSQKNGLLLLLAKLTLGCFALLCIVGCIYLIFARNWKLQQQLNHQQLISHQQLNHRQ